MTVFLWLFSQFLIFVSVALLIILAGLAALWLLGRAARIVVDRVTGKTRRRHARPRERRRSTRVDPHPDIAPMRALEVPPRPDTPPAVPAATQPIPQQRSAA